MRALQKTPPPARFRSTRPVFRSPTPAYVSHPAALRYHASRRVFQCANTVFVDACFITLTCSIAGRERPLLCVLTGQLGPDFRRDGGKGAGAVPSTAGVGARRAKMQINVKIETVLPARTLRLE